MSRTFSLDKSCTKFAAESQSTSYSQNRRSLWPCLAVLGWSSEPHPLSHYQLLRPNRPNSELEMGVGSLYFCGILGANDPIEDDWMATDIAVAAALVENPGTTIQLFTTVAFREFSCCQNGYFKFGDHGADRLEVPVPDDALVVLNRSGAGLKNHFLQKISSITTHMKPSDQLIVFIAAHGEENNGDVLIGEQPLKISEVASVIKNNATVLWSTACFSEQWLEGKVPWYGYVGAASNEESGSLVPSDSNYNRGGVSMLTTFATLAADQNAIVPLPYRTRSESVKESHYFEEPTPISEQLCRSLQQLAAQANIAKNDLSVSYDAHTTADSQTQRPLPVPQLTSEVLNRFRLVRQSPAVLTTTPKTNKSGCFRHIIQQLPPVPGLDLQELVESGTLLLDSEPSQAGLVFLSGRLQRSSFSEADLRILWSAFSHRRKCQASIESYIDWAGWQTTRRPQWDFSGGGSVVELEMVAADEQGAAWRAFFCWRPQAAGWRNLTWTDIRQQLALAWEAAEKPHFSAADFLTFADRIDDFRKESVLIATSPSLQTILHSVNKNYSRPVMSMTTSHSWPSHAPHRIG
ncbi:hypothetical protein FB451DRAFT_1161520 [Mycena latifolia]|nr:hypothetical protein FB451DRAFT_1161520 [Mycena latifolia]